ncbi:MAG: type II toxin-antitoxin system RelE/ParE family toxin [Iphinoe sp. HA4291-MV1]|nr:type II toxin-antitoxin system RelE/ParE family toxin [Iphinoe sp. HA4291-MV1]
MLSQTVSDRTSCLFKPLKEELAGYYRYRIGNYRVIYQIDDDTNQVIVNTIVHRREAYK